MENGDNLGRDCRLYHHLLSSIMHLLLCFVLTALTAQSKAFYSPSSFKRSPLSPPRPLQPSCLLFWTRGADEKEESIAYTKAEIEASL